MSRLGTTILIGALLATGTQALGADFWRGVGRDLQDAFSEDNMRETFEPVVQAFSEDNMRETFAPVVDIAEDAIDALKDAYEIDVEQPAPAFVDDYIVLSDDGIEQAFQPLVELANWTIPEIAENITAFFTESIPLEI